MQPTSGAQGRDRTTDTVIFNHVLYQLSYLGDRTRKSCGAGEVPRVIMALLRTVQDAVHLTI
jgi:hypothetical protein